MYSYFFIIVINKLQQNHHSRILREAIKMNVLETAFAADQHIVHSVQLTSG
jgi:hypothetical protein